MQFFGDLHETDPIQKLTRVCFFTVSLPRYFHREEIIQPRADHGDRAQFANLIPARRDRRGENVRPEFELQSQREMPCEDQSGRGEVGRFSRHKVADHLRNCHAYAQCDESGTEYFDTELQPSHGDDDRSFDGFHVHAHESVGCPSGIGLRGNRTRGGMISWF